MFVSTALLSASQAALRLGVKVETVYAYVSRGMLPRTLGQDGHSSWFEPADIDAMAERGRGRRGRPRAGTVAVSLSTEVSGIVEGDLVYRGARAAQLSSAHAFETVAEWLWTAQRVTEPRWPRPLLDFSALQLPAGAGPLECYAAAVAHLAAAHPLRFDLRPERVVEHGRVLVASLSAVLPPLTSRARRPSRSVAQRLFTGLTTLPPTAARVALLDCALGLLADHELATSTLAARVAASTRADPFAVVLAGLGAVAGPLHGRAGMAVQRLVADAAQTSPEAAYGRLLAAGEAVPGFGHKVYRDVDPRAACLLARLQAHLKERRWAQVARLIDLGRESAGAMENIDFALGVLGHELQMRPGSTEAIFALARTVGWTAHALEEYRETALRFRARSIYLGPTPEP